MKRGALTKDQQIQALNAKLQIVNATLTRAMLISQMGQSYGGNRDLYEVLGYPATVDFTACKARYTRQDIAKRIINAFPDACWSKPPSVEESEDEETPFEKAWGDLVKKIPVWSYLKRVDRMSRVYRYGALLMGFDDGKSLDQPVSGAKRLLYLRPFYEEQAPILEWDSNVSSERYGLPLTYNVNITQPPVIGTDGINSKIFKVHQSRILHVADDLTSDDVYGTPALEAVYNRLQDLEMIAGGGAEMWWRGAFPGLGFKNQEGAVIDEADVPALEAEIENYIHGLKRYLKLKNIDIQQLQPQIGDSTKPFDVEITLISVATGIPKRILMGTERGELASSQDSSEWDDRVDERRTNYCAPCMLRPFIDRLILAGVLPKPGSYEIYWDAIHVMNEKEKAEIARTKTEAITKFAGTPGSEFIIPVKHFLTDVLGYDDEKASLIMDELKSSVEDELTQIRKEQAASLAAERSNGGRSAEQPV